MAMEEETPMKVLFDLYYPRLYYFAYKLIKVKVEAQDIAQETLMALWQHRAEFKDAELKDAEAYMFAIVRNKSHNLIKHAKMKALKRDEICDAQQFSDELLEARLIQEDIFNRIYQEILQLSPPQVRLLKMLYLEGLETKEIASQLNITPNNVRNQKARVLDKIRTVLLRKKLLTVLKFFLVFVDFL
jgi:RNA polymerase sigma factor (sigma-70 family)